jgi:branched-subunit amino acid ABC-type transport system permease component
MDFASIVTINVIYAIASLFIISIGLAVIYGMMGVINFAHGEFMMLGGFTFIFAVRAGLNVWIAMLAAAPLAVAVFGMVVERLIVRHLYGRTVDTILATWGVSLIMTGTASILFGYFQVGVSPPLGSFSVGVYRQSWYGVAVIAVAALSASLLYAVLRWTRFGMLARGTMQNPGMASAMGTNVRQTYAITFACGSALSGLAGAVFAPLAGVVPTMGALYIAKAFITVTIAGALPLVGTAVSAALLGTIDQLVTTASRAVIGDIAMLLAAICVLRVLPAGITGRFFRGGV